MMNISSLYQKYFICMDTFYKITDDRSVFIPDKYVRHTKDRPFKEFTGRAVTQHDKIFRYLQSGGVVLLGGNWNEILNLYEYIKRKKNELFKFKRQRIEKRVDSLQYQQIFYRLALCSQRNKLLVDSPQCISFLFNFVGEIENGKNEKCFYIPVYDYLKINDSISKQVRVDALNDYLVSHYSVLPPASQKIYTLFKTTLETLLLSIPIGIYVLDMGCGSGVLTIITAKVIGSKLNSIHATDILPEAIGTCKYNINEFHKRGIIDKQKIKVLDGSDLFSGIDQKMQYNLILFNAPWTIQRKTSKENKAVADYEFAILSRFLKDAVHFLKTDGNILLCYSDHSGKNVIASVEELIKENGYKIQNRYYEKIRAKRKSQKWEKFFIYHLSHQSKQKK